MKTNFILFVLFAFAGKLFAQVSHDIAFVDVSHKIEYVPFIRESSPKVSKLSFAHFEAWFKNKKREKAILGYTNENRPVEIFYFPGISNKRALVIGGMHGSELSSIEIAKKIIRQLSNGETSYYDVLVIPSLFPDNAVAAASTPWERGNTNFGRYTSGLTADPNRQMPCLGAEFNANEPFDFHGRVIEKENQYLLQLIQDYKPARIVNLHAIKDVSKAGIYADPRTNCEGMALGFETDSTLAVSMAKYICGNGGWVPGNNLTENPTALYYHDPEIAVTGSIQKRNLDGSPLPNNRGYGVSLGGWATTAVCNETNRFSRDAIRLITVEFPGYRPPSYYLDKEQKEACLQNIQLYSEAITCIFLSNILVEVDKQNTSSNF